MEDTDPIRRSILWNLLGQATPLVVAALAIPPVVHALGADRFGALAIVWVIIGYLGLFDLGIGRALTRAIAERRGQDTGERLRDVAWTALVITVALGLVAAIVGATLSGWLVTRVLRVPLALQPEMQRSVIVLALSMPFVLSTAGLRGILEAHGRFGIVNAIRAVMGAYQFLAPLAVITVTRDLGTVVLVLAIGRLAAWVAHLVATLLVMPQLRSGARLARGEMTVLVREGGWMTVTNVVGPVLVYLDRFLLGALVSMEAVAWYATPFEIVSRLLVVPSALCGVLFPAFAADHTSRPERAGEIYSRSLAVVLSALFPLVLVLSAFPSELLRAWVGPEFALHGAVVLRWLTLGVMINALAHVPFTLLQAVGRSHVTARLHMAEMPLYALGAWWAIRAGGVEGAAIAWTARIALDTAALFLLARPHAGTAGPMGKAWSLALVSALLAVAAVDVAPGLATRIVTTVVALTAFGWIAWRWLLGRAERDWIRARLVDTRES